MEAKRKPLAKVAGRCRQRLSGLMIAWRGTLGLDNWEAYIEDMMMKSKKLVLADHDSERKVRAVLSRAQTMPGKEVEKLANGLVTAEIDAVAISRPSCRSRAQE